MNKKTIVLIVVAILLMAGIFVERQVYINDLNAKHEEEIAELNRQLDDATEVVVKYVDEKINQKFDTSALDNWCTGEDEGLIRMVAAYPYAREDGMLTLEDELGELWLVEDMDIDDNDYVLLWIADNGTSNDATDDVVLKVYTEVHD